MVATSSAQANLRLGPFYVSIKFSAVLRSWLVDLHSDSR